MMKFRLWGLHTLLQWSQRCYTLSLEEQNPGSQEPQAFVLAIKPALRSTGPRACLFILWAWKVTLLPGLGSRGNGLCAPVMHVKRGPQDNSLQVSRLTLLSPQNVRLSWDMKVVGVVCLLWPEGCDLGLRRETLYGTLHLQGGAP